MIEDALVSYRLESGIATLQLNDPAGGNALSVPLATELAAALESASDDPDAKMLILQARGRNFCVGGDVFEMYAADDRGAHIARLTEAAHRCVRAMVEYEKPIVAALHGAVAGGAIGLALAADYAVADESTKFVFAYPAIGVTPDCGTSWFLPRSLGMGKALKFGLTDEPIRAVDAATDGLIAEVVPTGTAHDRAHEVAEDFIARDPDALGTMRSLMRQSWGGLTSQSILNASVLRWSRLCAANAPRNCSIGLWSTPVDPAPEPLARYPTAGS